MAITDLERHLRVTEKINWWVMRKAENIGSMQQYIFKGVEMCGMLSVGTPEVESVTDNGNGPSQ